ncbi:MAG: hypothetical protein Q7T19_15360 [Caulobacter sp.]|nr:hypothetical protein [Caulobacter sp.]
MRRFLWHEQVALPGLIACPRRAGGAKRKNSFIVIRRQRYRLPLRGEITRKLSVIHAYFKVTHYPNYSETERER